MQSHGYTINIKGTLFDLASPRIMGILNVTDDSFFDGGAYNKVGNALDHARQMVEQGVDIIDVGGASSRPGAKLIPVSEEAGRVVPVIEELKKQFPGIPVSIDTFHAEVARQAIKAGADIINDISAGDDDPEMLEVVAQSGLPYIAMHKQGTPESMQENPSYNDVVSEVLDYFVQKLESYRSMGIHDVIVDPGFGFGKTVQHNYALLHELKAFGRILDRPVLVGVSRKSMINKVLGTKASEALNGTTVLNTLALHNGAAILRVHDVKEAVEVVKLWQAYGGNSFENRS